MAKHPRIQAKYDLLKTKIQEDTALLERINPLLKKATVDRKLELIKNKVEIEDRLKKTNDELARLERLRPVWGTLEQEEEESGLKLGIPPHPPQEKPAYNVEEDELAELKKKLKGRGR